MQLARIRPFDYSNKLMKFATCRTTANSGKGCFLLENIHVTHFTGEVIDFKTNTYIMYPLLTIYEQFNELEICMYSSIVIKYTINN